jgi:hypothetical protein
MKMKKNYIVFSILWVLVFGLAACGISPDETVPVAVQDVPATPTRNIEPLPTMFVEEPTVTATEAVEVIMEETAVPPNNLQTYTNVEAGFSLCYPARWSAADVDDVDFVGLGSRSVQFSQDTVTLVIGYRNAGAVTAIMGTGAPAGELETDSYVVILGQDVLRHLIVLDGRVQAVFYGQPGSVITAGDLEFSPRLDDFMQGEIDLSSQVQAEADLILSSLSLGSDAAGCSE